MKKIISILFFIGLAVSPVVFARVIPFTEWQYRAKIVAPMLSRFDFVMLDLPSELFSYMNPDLSDLRVVNGDGNVPYVAAIEKESSWFTLVPARMFNLSSKAGQNTEFMIDVGAEGTLHNSIEISTPSENFRRIVEIQGSNDQSTWRTLTPKGQIYDYTVRDIKPVKVHDASVSYPEATFRYLLVRIYDQGDAPLKVTGVTVWRRVALSARELSFTPQREISENEAEKSTEVILDLGAAGIPHERGRIETSSTNFSRVVSLYDSNDKKEWRLLKQDYLFVIHTPKFSGSNLDFSYPESNRRYVKLAIANGDDNPITIGGATLFGTIRRILFSYEPGKEYYLYVGNKKAERPQYDIEKISQYIDVTTLNRATAGPAEKNPAYIEPEPEKKPFAERSPYVLPVVLGMIIVILGFLLLRLVMKKGTAL